MTDVNPVAVLVAGIVLRLSRFGISFSLGIAVQCVFHGHRINPVSNMCSCGKNPLGAGSTETRTVYSKTALKGKYLP